MKKVNLSHMSEDDLFGSHCETSHELADLTRAILDGQKRVNKLAKLLDKIELEMEQREANVLREQDMLN